MGERKKELYSPQSKMDDIAKAACATTLLLDRMAEGCFDGSLAEKLLRDDPDYAEVWFRNNYDRLWDMLYAARVLSDRVYSDLMAL